MTKQQVERRRTRTTELRILSKATKVMEKVSSQFSDYEATKAEVGRLTQVVGMDRNSGLQFDVCNLKDTVNGNPAEKITGLVPDLGEARKDIGRVKSTGIAVIATIGAIIGTPLLWLLGNHPELLAQIFKGKSGVQ